MNTSTMQQYLAKVKNIVDTIAASGSTVDPKDIILHILNGLPASYNSIKTYIRSSLLPADLDALYSLLCSEEIHVNQTSRKNNLRLQLPITRPIPAKTGPRTLNRTSSSAQIQTKPPPLQINQPPRQTHQVIDQSAKYAARLVMLRSIAGTGVT
ncbi:hypothetical protein MA16_Dca002237 [Dendrobium catenatum]|uniref:Retrovirus-related Pol polyprotein from transposon TNT 1-94 n=1 Tax=Dendrobium catenatum TaxID=906689 RepID=A0A2I0VZZ8_9ASPA|nr:hypothetical protein MA16_Dca002237 [Dendrobium catenatum]